MKLSVGWHRIWGIELSKSNLGDSKVDKEVALARGIYGALPFVGPLISEIISTTIPNQRIDRISMFLEELGQRVTEIEQESLKDNKYFVDLFEDAIIQAARTFSEERNKYLAIFIANNKSLQKDDYSTKKKLLYLLSEMTDFDIKLLKSFRDEGPFERTTYTPRFISNEEYASSDEPRRYELDIEQVSYAVHLETLERLGLLDKDMVMPNVTEQFLVESIEEASVPKKVGNTISLLGRVLLKSIEI